MQDASIDRRTLIFCILSGVLAGCAFGGHGTGSTGGRGTGGSATTTIVIGRNVQGSAVSDTNPKELTREYDFRLNEIETRDEEIRRAQSDDDKGALQVYIWRAVRGTSDFQPLLPKFANTHMAGLVVLLEGVGFTDHAEQAIQAARDLENGGVDAHAHQSPHGYGVFSQDYLDSRLKSLRNYSDYIHRKMGS
jgi:hypothetical protein